MSELQASTIVSYESLLLNVVMCVHLTIELYSLCKSAKFSVWCAIPRALVSKCHHSFGIGVFHVCIENPRWLLKQLRSHNIVGTLVLDTSGRLSLFCIACLGIDNELQSLRPCKGGICAILYCVVV